MNQLERTKARLAKLEREADIKRLKIAEGYLRSGLTALEDNFHDEKFDGLATEIAVALEGPLTGIAKAIGEN